MPTPKRRAAKRPPSRTVVIKLDGPFEGWEATCKADAPWRVLADLGSDSLDRIIAGLDGLVIDHNFPDSTDEVAASMGEVDPSDAVQLLAERYPEAVGKLPPR